MRQTVVMRAGERVSIPVSRRFLLVAPLLLLALGISVFGALAIGHTGTAPGDVLSALLLPLGEMSREARAVAQFRLPRVMVALLAGAMMAASGYLLQVVTRNGLADPGILGLSDGATVAVILTAMAWGPLPSAQLTLVSLAGAFATAAFVLTIGRGLINGGGIILIGLAINIVLGAIVETVLAAGTASQFSALMIWTRGTLDAVDAADMRVLLRWGAALLPLSLLVSRLMQPMLLGDETARALGVPARFAVALFVLLATGFAAPVVAVCGPIAFIGLMSAYIARSLVGERPTEILLTATLSGALILLWADTLGRSLFSPVTVSAGIMVSVVGALAFIIVARGGQRFNAA